MAYRSAREAGCGDDVAREVAMDGLSPSPPWRAAARSLGAGSGDDRFGPVLVDPAWFWKDIR
jgi:hypothetical protein